MRPFRCPSTSPPAVKSLVKFQRVVPTDTPQMVWIQASRIAAHVTDGVVLFDGLIETVMYLSMRADNLTRMVRLEKLAIAVLCQMKPICKIALAGVKSRETRRKQARLRTHSHWLKHGHPVSADLHIQPIGA